LVLLFQGVLISVSSLGLSSSVARFTPATAPPVAKGVLLFALKANLLALLVLTPVIWIGAGWIRVGFGVPGDMVWLLPAAAIAAIGPLAEALLDAFFKARELIKRQLAFLGMRTAIEIAAVTSVFAFSKPTYGLGGAEALGWYLGAGLLLRLLLYPWLLVGTAGTAVKPDGEERRRVIAYGLPLVPSALLLLLLNQEDRLILGHLVPSAALGLYAFGASLAAYLNHIGTAVFALVLPRVARHYDRGETGQAAALIADSQQVFIALYGATFAGLLLLGREVILVTAGEAFLGALTTFMVLGFAVGAERLFGAYEFVFHAARKTGVVAWINGAYVVLVGVGVLVASSLGGITATPWGVLAAVLVANGLRFWLARQLMPISFGTKLAMRVIGTSAVLGLLAAVGLTAPLAIRFSLSLVAGVLLVLRLRILLVPSEPLTKAPR
jgi:O-antigen/teichoic acid export membrane protein